MLEPIPRPKVPVNRKNSALVRREHSIYGRRTRARVLMRSSGL